MGVAVSANDADIAKLCSYISDDGAVASYFDISRQRVAAIRTSIPVRQRNPRRFLESRSEPSHVDGTDAHRAARSLAEEASAKLLREIERTGQKIAPEIPKRKLSFEEQLALVASGKVGIVDLGA